VTCALHLTPRKKPSRSQNPYEQEEEEDEPFPFFFFFFCGSPLWCLLLLLQTLKERNIKHTEDELTLACRD
jgi:hypothetical protein